MERVDVDDECRCYYKEGLKVDVKIEAVEPKEFERERWSAK